jgi:hypothetical protein
LCLLSGLSVRENLGGEREDEDGTSGIYRIPVSARPPYKVGVASFFYAEMPFFALEITNL